MSHDKSPTHTPPAEAPAPAMRSSSHNVALQETARAEASTVAVGLVAAVGPAAMSAVTAKTLLISEHGSTATSKVHTAPASAEGVDVTQPRYVRYGTAPLCCSSSVAWAGAPPPALEVPHAPVLHN